MEDVNLELLGTDLELLAMIEIRFFSQQSNQDYFFPISQPHHVNC